MSPWVYICALVFVAFWALFAWLYNSLVRKRLGTENAWSQIEVQLKRRHDLIPNLVETVRGYASHEKDTLERVIQARNAAVEINSASMTEIKQVEDSLSSILRQLFALSENYPELKANENFVKLHEELASTENRIGFARQHFNDSVSWYNAATEMVPSMWVARLTGFESKEFFELSETERENAEEAPQVAFQ